MKKLLALLVLTVITTVPSFAQLEQGHIAYDIEMSSDDPDMAMTVMMFQGSSMDLYFNENKARTDLDMGALMSMTTVVDNETQEVLILMGGMMGDKAILTSSDEMGEDSVEVEEPTIELTKETKKILGYKCKKAIITDADGNEMDYWYTEEIKAISTDENATVSKLPGLALQYTVDRDGMIMSFTATKVETKLDAATIKAKLTLEIPEGYEVMTYEEFTSFGGM